MSEAQNVDILSGVCKAVGDFGEGLKSFMPLEKTSLMAAGHMDMRHVEAVTVALQRVGFAPGHPLGATGKILTVKTASKLRCTGGRYSEAA